jgi:hypothetical protein
MGNPSKGCRTDTIWARSLVALAQVIADLKFQQQAREVFASPVSMALDFGDTVQ